MEIQETGAAVDWGMLVAAERGRLVGLCRYLTGDAEVAEDLAQETLAEAWRHAHKLRDPSRIGVWLGAIAHNVCRRWGRRRRQDLAWRPPLAFTEDGQPIGPTEQTDTAVDLEIELEADELTALLDRALALLPPATRAVLVARYVQESPLADLAARLGVSEAAVTMKLQRGKLALRRVLITDFGDQARSYGLGPADQDAWRETRIWCWRCGQRRLIGRYTKDQPDGVFNLKCPHCCALHGWGLNVSYTDVAVFASVLGEVTTFKPALSRLMTHTHSWWTQGLASRSLACPHCGQAMSVRLGPLPGIPPSLQHESAFSAICTHCNLMPNEALAGLVISSPEGQRFWREHPRMHLLPERDVETEGRAARLISFESLDSTARLDAVCDSATFALLRLHGAPS